MSWVTSPPFLPRLPTFSTPSRNTTFTLHPRTIGPTSIMWKTAKHPGIIVFVCVRACLGTRHLSERHSAICHSDTQTVAHILTPRANRPHPPLPALRSGFPSSPSFTDSFWFPFWFLTSEAISGQPVVPLILTAYCVVSWAGPWAPGAGRGARNDLVPVAVQAKELWHHFH